MKRMLKWFGLLALRDRFRRRLKTAGATVLLLAAVGIIGGFLLSASGIIPIKASSGHWAITAWFLNFSMARSVDTHSLGIEAPPLDDPARILRGAGHYQTACAPCHGSPEFPTPPVARRMTPPPPYLPPKIPLWDPEELFYIVKHGVKLTGMPAWPALHRDDEVWDVTAFLLRLPELGPEEYRELVYGPAQPSPDSEGLDDLIPGVPGRAFAAEACARCHGIRGMGRGDGAFPILTGQKEAYLREALEAFARGERHSGMMQPVAAGLSGRVIAELARYFSAQERPPGERKALGPGSIERGREIAFNGIPRKRVPVCAECHGPNASERNEHYPFLAGQPSSYLVRQLELFKKGHRGGSEYAHLMEPAASRLTTEEMRDVAAFYESLELESEP